VAVVLAAFLLVAIGYLAGWTLVVFGGVVLAIAWILDIVVPGAVGGLGAGWSAKREIRPLSVFAGESVTVRLAGPATAELTDHYPESIIPLRRTVAASARRRVVLTTTAETTRRGCFEIGPAVGRRLGPLALWRLKATVAQPNPVTVWPHVAPLTGMTRTSGEETLASAGLALPHPEDATVRDYRPGDDIRRIHWRSSARRGHLVTRAEEPVHTPHLHLVLAVVPTAERDEIEQAISLAASLCLSLTEAGFHISLTTGDDSGSTVIEGPWSDHLDHLATLDAATLGSHRAVALALGTPWALAEPSPSADAPGDGDSSVFPRSDDDVWLGRSAEQIPTLLRIAVVAGPAGARSPISSDTSSGDDHRSAWIGADLFDHDGRTLVRPLTTPGLAVLAGGDDPVLDAALIDAGWATIVVPSAVSLDDAALQLGEQMRAVMSGAIR
jgi:uncharacterized protein (DUF58 family)